MKIILDQNNQLNCAASNPLFTENVVSILSTISPYLENINTFSNQDLTDSIISLGDKCQTILLTKLGNSKDDLFDDENYKNVFVGLYAENYIEIMMLIQKIWQLASSLDSYPTLELFDKGVRDNDKEYFINTLKLLHNKLLLLENKVQKKPRAVKLSVT